MSAIHVVIYLQLSRCHSFLDMVFFPIILSFASSDPVTTQTLLDP